MEFCFLVENQQNESEITLMRPLMEREVQRPFDNHLCYTQNQDSSLLSGVDSPQDLSPALSGAKGPQASVLSFSSDTKQISNLVAWFLVSLEVEKALKFSVMVSHVCWCLPSAHLQRSTRGSSLAS